MKTITIEVPQDGTSVQLLSRGAASSAQAIIVAADNVEIRQVSQVEQPVFVMASDSPSAETNGTPAKQIRSAEFDIIYATLVDQRVKRRTAAVNVIKTMFQFTKPITTETANKMFDDLRKCGYLAITPTGTIEFREQRAAPPA